MELRDQAVANPEGISLEAVTSVPASEQLRLLEQQIRLRLVTGTERLKDDQVDSAAILRTEAGYLAQHIEQAIRGRIPEERQAVQKACDYLGWRLHELSWTLEQSSEMSQQALSALLDSLEPQVRECWTNALRFLVAGDVGLAKQHFASLVSVAPIRHLAHQYLGFVAARLGDKKDSIKNFDLARKYAETDRDRALASSHLAGSWYAAGDPMRAAKAALVAAESYPDDAKFWYEAACYCARLGKSEHLEEFLTSAIRRDWLYWPLAIVDPIFDPARAEVAAILATMREEQKGAVRSQLGKLREIVSILRETEAGAEVLSALEIADDLEREFKEGGIFTYLRLSTEIPEAQKKFLRRAIDGFDKRLREVEAGMGNAATPANLELLEAKVAQVQEMLENAQEKDKVSSWLTVFRTVAQLWSAIGIPGTAWAIYDWVGAAGAEKVTATNRLMWLGIALIGPWLALAGFIYFLHRLPAKLIRQRAADLQGQIEKSTQWRERRSADEMAKAAEDLDRLIKQRQTLEEYLRGLA